MTDLVPKLKEITVAPEKLILDPNNPRLITKDEDRKSAEAAIDLMPETMDRMRDERNHISEIERSIKRNGWLPVDYIFVRKFDDHGRYVVLEGNRRVTAIRGLLNDPELDSTLREQLQEIPVMEITDDLPDADIQRKITYLLGVRHHGSLKKWSPFAQAYNIRKRYKELCGEDIFVWNAELGKQIAEALSIDEKEVKNRLQVYCAMEQVGNSEVVKASEPEGGGMKDRYYSVVSEVVLKPKKFEGYIEQDQETFLLDDESVARMVNLCHFDKKARQGSPINKPQEWRKLENILTEEDDTRREEMLAKVEIDKEKPSDVWADRATELQALQWDQWLLKVLSIIKQVTIDDLDAEGAADAASALCELIASLEKLDTK
jgi:hypothetical protein